MTCTAKRVWRATAVLVLVACAATTGLRADVLITQNGGRFEGEVKDEGDKYLVITPDGGKMRFSKSSVREVVRPETFKAEFAAMVKAADLKDDGQVARLAAFAAEKGLADERQKMLGDAFALRLRNAEGKPEALRALAAWCTGHKMAEEAGDCGLRADRLEFAAKLSAAGDDAGRLESLAQWCLARKLTEETARCLAGTYAAKKQQATTGAAQWQLAKWCHSWKQAAWRDERQSAALRAAIDAKDFDQLQKYLDDLKGPEAPPEMRAACLKAMYTVRLGLAGDYASALARLALWCADNDLQVEAAEAEAAALRGKPDDPDIRELLGYIREKPGGPWVKMDWWRAKVIKATLTVGYSDNTFSYSPEDNSLAVGQVEVEFEALSAAPGNLQERLGPAKDILTKEALAYLMGGEAPGERGNEGAELVRRPSRLFMSPNVLLILADGTKIPPAFTSRLPGYGCTIGGNTIELSSTWSVTTESAPVGVIRYIRGDRLTAALVEPRKKVTVTFVYPVPVGTRQATLRFYNCPPTSLTFIKG